MSETASYDALQSDMERRVVKLAADLVQYQKDLARNDCASAPTDREAGHMALQNATAAAERLLARLRALGLSVEK